MCSSHGEVNGNGCLQNVAKGCTLPPELSYFIFFCHAAYYAYLLSHKSSCFFILIFVLWFFSILAVFWFFLASNFWLVSQPLFLSLSTGIAFSWLSLPVVIALFKHSTTQHVGAPKRASFSTIQSYGPKVRTVTLHISLPSMS